MLIHSFNDVCMHPRSVAVVGRASLMQHQINYSILVLAIIGAGGVFTGSNPSYTPAELAHHIQASESKFLISEPEILDPLLRAAKQVGVTDQNVWIFDNLGQSVPAGRKSFKTLMEYGEKDWVRFNDLDAVQTTAAARLFSSGTTGLPKAVTITHYNFIAEHELVLGVNPRPYPVSEARSMLSFERKPFASN